MKRRSTHPKLTRRDLLGYLANRNVLPKYGFPVDTVELRTSYPSSPVGGKLDLTRDLSMAIYEYAPGSQVVAGGFLWRSGGVYRLPDRELVGKHYFICEQCQHYWEGEEDIDSTCPSCSVVARHKSAQYYVPEFGFVAESTPSKTCTAPELVAAVLTCGFGGRSGWGKILSSPYLWSSAGWGCWRVARRPRTRSSWCSVVRWALRSHRLAPSPGQTHLDVPE
jgi:hypothetical protein